MGSAWRTRFTELVGTQLPIVQTGMGGRRENLRPAPVRQGRLGSLPRRPCHLISWNQLLTR
jgi:NAD(P)H-dependent flavin oxidoreductase YrpB (nitropropane dioxygenase family)